MEVRSHGIESLADYCQVWQDDVNRLLPFLGRWKGSSLTKRSGVYGATMAEHDTIASLEIDESGQLIQVRDSPDD